MTTTISIRTDPKLKEKASKILRARGLSMTSAFNIYLNEVVTSPVKNEESSRRVPDHIMHKWEKERIDALKNGKRYATVEEFMGSLRK